QKYGWLSFDKALADNLKVMDATAFTLCRENNIPIVVFDMNTEGTLEKIVAGENLGTVVCNE
ncbi:MAG: UMP kinase, partial [Bacteroidales bacterium]|nr:UMP kinase [Bacteroidales bacterium]